MDEKKNQGGLNGAGGAEVGKESVKNGGWKVENIKRMMHRGGELNS